MSAERTMTLNDLCDRCRHSAYVKATVHNVELLFCGHHFTRHEDEIRAVASEVVDEREFIEPDRLPMAEPTRGRA